MIYLGENMKKYRNYLIAFIIPTLIVLLSLLLNKYYPFGDKVLLMLDGYNQYPGFLSNFKEIILHNGSLFYSFKGITGFNLYASNVYYSLNLTNLLFLFFKNNHIVDFYTFIIIFKIGLCSLTMQTFLNYLNKAKYNIIFSICYALTAYNILYYLNYMWFDSIIMLPLVILGIEKIFKEKNYIYYTISLTLTIIFNFYIGYMICIFSFLYFIYKWLINKENKKVFFKYLFYSLLSGLIASLFLIPIILELFNGKGEIFSNVNYFIFDLDFINIFYKLTLGSLLNGDLEYGTPNVYASIFIYVSVIMYFFNKNIKTKDKVISFTLLLIFLLSVSFNLFDYFWQMLQMPIYYPVRYAFIFDFYLIYLAYENYKNYEKLSLKKLLIIFGIIIILSSIGFVTSGNLIDKINIPAKLIYLGISFLFIIYYLFILNNDFFKKFICALVIIELTLNTFVTFRNNGNVNDIQTFNANYTMNYNIIKNLNLDNFNKVSFEDKTIKNNGLLLNYNDLNYFSSVRNNKSFKALNKIFGILTVDGCNLNYYYNNPITNAILNIKYYITSKNLNYYELIRNYDNYSIYENKDISGIGFIVNKEISNFKNEEDYINNINNFVKLINNNDKDILKDIEPTDKNVNCSKNNCIINGYIAYIKYEYTPSTDEILFVQNDFPIGVDKSSYNLKINEELIDYDSRYPIKVKKKDKIELIINPGEDYKDYYYHLYGVDFNIYKEFISNIQKEKLEIIEYKNASNFTGKITLENDGLLFTTISNDKGWKVFVDDEEYKITPIFDGFIGLNLNKGEHTIRFQYTPPGFYLGLLVSSISIIVFGLSIYLDKKKKLGSK